MASRFRNNLRFALLKESQEIREQLPPNWMEKVGDHLSWFVYDFKQICSKTIFDPRVVTIWLTAFVMAFVSVLFYPIYTLDIILDIFFEIMARINGDYVRFCLWMISEISILGLGVRAFGRFTNQKLLKHYEDQQSRLTS